jgi:hypothetical protein
VLAVGGGLVMLGALAFPYRRDEIEPPVTIAAGTVAAAE